MPSTPVKCRAVPTMERFIEEKKFNPLTSPDAVYRFRQYILAFASLLQSACVGSILGYSSILFPQLEESKEIVLTIDQASWIASIPTLVMLPFVLSAGWFMGILGRRVTLTCVYLVTLTAWILTYFANSYETLFVSRLVAGFFVGGAYPVMVTYMGEITHPKIRAVCLSSVPLGMAVGVLLTQFLGIYLHWRTVAVLIAIFPIHNLFVAYYISESHIWLLNKNRVDEARRAFIWFRGFDVDAKAEFNAALESKDNVVAINNSIKEKIKFCFSKAFMMPFLLTALLFFTSEFSGDTALIFYTSHIIKIITSNPEVQYFSNLILNILRVVATLTSAMLIKRFSIRMVFIATGFALACSLTNIALFLYLSGAYP